MGFRTKIDYSYGRQIKQNQNSFTILPGQTQFGDEYPNRLLGPDLLSINTQIEISNIISTFSGNTTSINFTFGSPYMTFTESLLPPYSGSTTGITQTIESVFVGYNPVTLHGNTYYQNYSGVTYDITVTEFIDLGGGNYSGTTFTENLEILSAPSLDYVGDNVMHVVRGISQIDFLETYSGVTFYNLDVATSVDYIYGKDPSTGSVVEIPASGFTGNSLWQESVGLNSLVPTNHTATALGVFAIATGSNTQANGDYSIADGSDTIAQGQVSRASGGSNQANGDYSSTDGLSNIAQGYASRATGSNTQANGDYSLSKGYATSADGDYSETGGVAAVATHHNEWIRGNAFSGRHNYGFAGWPGNTNNNTVTEIFLDESSAVFTVETSTLYAFDITATAATNTMASSFWKFEGMIKNTGGVTSFVGTPTKTLVTQDPAMAGTDIDIIANNTSDYLQINVTGLPVTGISWNVVISYNKLIG